MDEQQLLKAHKAVAKRYGEDLAQDVVIRLLEREAQGREKPKGDDLTSLALKVAHDLQVDQQRKEQRTEKLTSDGLLPDTESTIDPERIVSARQQLRQINPNVVAAYSGEAVKISERHVQRLRLKDQAAANTYEVNENDVA